MVAEAVLPEVSPARRRGRRPPRVTAGRAPIVRPGPETPPISFGGGRVSRDADTLTNRGSLLATVAPPPDWNEQWRLLDLDRQTLSKARAEEVIRALADISPELSAAIWYWLRLAYAGMTVTVSQPNDAGPTATGEATPGAPGADVAAAANPQGQLVVDAYLAQLRQRHGSLHVLMSRIFMNALLRGGVFVEPVFDRAGRVGLDLAVPDAATARFRRKADPDLGQKWELGQLIDGNFVSYDDFPTVIYTPIDPMPDSPYGRPLVAPALFTSLFLLTTLHDLRRVIQQQGYPRIDISISLEQVIASMPAGVRNDTEKFKKWLNDTYDEVRAAIAKLEPDDLYLHYDFILVNRPVGTVDSGSLGAVEGLLKTLERMATRALHMSPLLMAIAESTSDANANRQWEMQLTSIQAIQGLVEDVLERVFGYVLQAAGVQGVVTVRFAKVRASEMLRDAQAAAAAIANAKAKYDHGWIDQDAAAREGAGVEKADAPEPRAAAAAPPDGANPNAATDGEEQPPPDELPDRPRRAARRMLGARAEPFVPEGGEAARPLPSRPGEVSDADLDRAAGEWDAVMPEEAEGLLEARPARAEDETDA